MPAHDVLRAIVGDAIRAPSSHNTQPWWFEIGQDRISLHADRTRALPVNDPHDRELTISCGCALFALRVAAAGQGLGATVGTVSGDDDDLLAVVQVGDGPADERLAALAAALPARRTHRKRFGEASVEDGMRDALVQAAEAEGGWFEPVDDARRREDLAELVTEGDAAQWADPRWRRELAAWMHPRRRGDGLSLPWLAVPAAKAVVRTFDMGDGVAARDRALAEASPLMGVVGTGGDSQADWIAAGQALHRMLLVAAGAGLQASYLNQPVQVAHLRPMVAELCRTGGMPQLVLRLGRPDEDLPPSPRRDLAEVVA